MRKDFIFIEDYDIDFALSSKDPAEIIKYVEQSSVNGLYFLDIELYDTLKNIAANLSLGLFFVCHLIKLVDEYQIKNEKSA